MKEFKKKKRILIFLVILLVAFLCLFIKTALKEHKTFGNLPIKKELFGYVFLGLIVILILLLFILFKIIKRLRRESKGIIKPKRNRREERRRKHEKPKEIEFFYLSQKGIEVVDQDEVRNILQDERIVEIKRKEDLEQEEDMEDAITVDMSELEVTSPISNPYEEKEELFSQMDTVENTDKIEVIGGDDSIPSHDPNKEEDEDINDTPLKDGESRFYNLTQIDLKMETYLKPRYNNEISLEEICIDFRNFCSRNLRLYYEIEDIRRFIGGLSVTKLIILQGMSGTGKTSLAYAFGEYLGNTTTVIPVQPMWKERTDLVGYYNEFTKRFNETQLLYKMYEANYNDEIYITVLDEMNIARIEYYFAEFLSLLEIPNLDGRMLDVVADKWENDPKKLTEKGQIKLPFNMWFIGTANNDDSTFAISDKVYDRAMVLNLDKKAKPFDAPKTDRLKLSIEHLTDLYKEAQRDFKMSDRNSRRIKKLDEYMIKTFHLTFGNRIMRQIESYVPVLVACGGSETEAIDDILSRKVFRKLESKNPVYVRQMADDICGYLDELFGENKLPLCKEAIRLIEQNI